MSQKKNCIYCNEEKSIAGLLFEIAQTPVSRIYFRKERRYIGRCVVATKEHKTELFELNEDQRIQYISDVSQVAQAIMKAFNADKINYGIFGDRFPHIHMHLVPKIDGGAEWGQQFTLDLSEPEPLSDEEFESCVARLKEYL